jgi:hypothetical protein
MLPAPPDLEGDDILPLLEAPAPPPPPLAP